MKAVFYFCEVELLLIRFYSNLNSFYYLIDSSYFVVCCLGLLKSFLNFIGSSFEQVFYFEINF